MLKPSFFAAVLIGLSASASAALPPPTPEQAAAAALAAAKTAHANKQAAFELCQSMDRVAADYAKEQKAKGKTVKPEATPACVPAGPFVPPPAAAAPAVPAAKK
ncbi:MAG: hypothetical protein RR412_01755 [Burkholderiaceae bacterium]